MPKPSVIVHPINDLTPTPIQLVSDATRNTGFFIDNLNTDYPLPNDLPAWDGKGDITNEDNTNDETTNGENTNGPNDHEGDKITNHEEEGTMMTKITKVTKKTQATIQKKSEP